jgi:autotransporter-associated beta strand protein
VANGDIAITGIAGQTLVLSAGTVTLTNPNVGSAALSSLNGASLANGTGLASNYTLTNPVGVVTITPASLGISASDAIKVYDINTSVASATTAPVAIVAVGTLYTNSVTGYVDSLFGGAFSYATSIAGSGNKTLNVSGVSILNDATSAASNYSITYIANTTSTISKAPITISGLSASNKVYDTGLTATITGTPTASGVLGSDVVTVNGSAGSGSFASANVGTGITVTPVISGLSLSNANYSITGITSPLAANITTAPITISGLSASNKVYDTGLTATITGTPTASGVLGSDVVTVNGSAGSGSFASANVGTGITVTPVISGLSLSNANYSITGITSPLAANISAAPITVTASAQTTVYGTPLVLGSSGFTTSGLLGSDAISSVTLTQLGNTTVPGTQNTGTYSGSSSGILPSGATGTNLSNYQITYAPGALTITKKSINVIADNASMTYADTNLPTLTYQSVSGLVNGDQMSGALATTATAYTGVAGSASNVGSYYITQGTVTAGSNYDITYTRASLTINPANLYVTAQNQSTIYGALLVLTQSGSSAYSTLGLRNGDYVSSATVLYSGNQTIPGTTNAGSYGASVNVSVANGLGMGNYNIAYVPGDLTISKAILTVTAVDSAKFVGMTDPSGYGGVIYGGFKNSDTPTSGALGSAVVSVSRSNSSENNAGSYAGVLTPNVSTDLTNYTVTYVPGKFTIMGANQLLVQVGSNSTVYGTVPAYNAGVMTVSYCTDCAPGISSPNIISISGAGVAVSGSSLTVVTGNTTATLVLAPVNPVMNSSGSQLTVGSYALTASGATITSSSGPTNFNAVTVVGGLGVTPLVLNYSDLGISGVTQVYNGSVNMSNISLSATSGILSGDAVTVSATGTFASKNVGINIPYTVGVSLSGLDAGNYQINGGSSFTGTNGVITQLNSVTYTGSNTGGNWSNPSNWTTTGTTNVGAIPDLSNVAHVILPAGSSVVYDDSVQGPVTSAVANSGNLNFNLTADTTVPMSISGTGTVTISGAGVVTLTGDSSYTGATILNPGANLIASANNAIGAGSITSNGTALNPAIFSTGGGIVLPRLNIAGGTTEIWSDIATAGTQTYSGSLLIGSSNTHITTFSSNNANITMNGILDGSSNKSESLVINAGTGTVTFVDSVGSIARLNNLTVTGSSIYVLADILTGMTQTYNGAVYIGDASYVGRTPVTGFLFTDHYKGYFQYIAGTGVSASTIDYLNTNPIYVRTMVSEDPSITYNGTVNDTVANTHTLLVAAVAPTVIPTSSGYATVNAGASINFNAAVGGSAPLYSLNTQLVVANVSPSNAASYIGTINLFGGAATYSNQTYRANLMTARTASQPGGVVFSVWDPAASVNFNLPIQTTANSGCSTNCGQVNLQNPNSLDSLTIYGSTNFTQAANLTGQNNWGNQLAVSNALGYVAPPPVIPPATLTATQQIPSIDSLSGGALREALDYHADQAQMFVDMKVLMAGVTVSTPEEIQAAPKKAGTTIKAPKNGDSSAICSVDEKGDMYCGDE